MTLSLALTACGGDEGESTAPAVASPTASILTRPVRHSDVEIAQLLYSDGQRTPAGFFKDTAPAFPGYVATLHLKNTDLAPASNAPQYELCTDDWATALGWSDHAAAVLQASILVETISTPRYHEFSRVRASTPQGYLRLRIYRCSYLDRSTTDLRTVAGAAGQLNQRPITALELQALSEYLWQFTTYNNYGHVVLKSSGTVVADGLEHTLIIASLATTAAQECDRIDVIAWSHTVSTQSGALRRDIQPLWEFGARRVNGGVELCNPF